MPLRGEGHSDLVRDEAPYFKFLDELDTWFAKPHNKLSGVLPYQPRPGVDGQSDSRGKLLVCHDYKVVQGGYSESPSGLCYTFNFWRLCDTFVYFSHHRVTVPPSGWTNSAHKQGTRILGTLIFEDDTDCLRLVVGHADHVVTDKQIPISNRYAVLLSELAHQRGFDGYLLNVESPLAHETDHAHALAGWILLLEAELRAKVGSHAQVVWYDSVIYNGLLWFQNTLNGKNLPFFLASDALFTNYWWKPKTQDTMAEYFSKLKRAVPDSHTSTDVARLAATKTLQSIYCGVDVWPGRGQYGDSGWCCYRAITYTSPKGLSTALFAPGWTWEKVTKYAEKNWSEWWDNERRLWLGPLKPGDVIQVPDSPEGPFKPMTEFFHDLPLPDPSKFAFYTHFSPGVGYSWFVQGKKVLDTKRGWSDIDKQTSIGNLVWPWPSPSWQGVEKEALPTASTSFDMTDGFSGGNTLKLTVSYAGGYSKIPVTKSIWLPVQSLAVTTQESFEACVVYKILGGIDVEVKSHIYVQSLAKKESDGAATFTVGQASTSDLPRGWARQNIRFSSLKAATVAIGFVVGFTPKTPATVTFSLSLGQLAVHPAPPPPQVSVGTPSVTGAKFAPTAHVTNTLEGVLTWNTASTFAPIDVGDIEEESITPAWLLHDTRAYRFPAFVYFNIYAAPLGGGSAHPDPGQIEFIGTTGLDGRANRFYVEPACFPSNIVGQGGVRFYIEGVTDRGEVLPRERCTTVDHHGKTSPNQASSD